MQKLYTNPHPTREPGSNKIVPEEEFRNDLKGYHPELQYSQLQPRNIDPDTLVRKSEGELMRTFQAKSLLGASLDLIQLDQLRVEQGKENAMRMDQIATETHTHRTVLDQHVGQMAAAPAHSAAVGGLAPHSEAAASSHTSKQREEEQRKQAERAAMHARAAM